MSFSSFELEKFKINSKFVLNDADLPPVTSSPLIDKKQQETSQKVKDRPFPERTWASLLGSVEVEKLNNFPPEPQIQKSKEKVSQWLQNIENNENAEVFSSRENLYEPVLVHKLHVSLTPKIKATVLCDSTRRLKNDSGKEATKNTKHPSLANLSGNSSGERILKQVRKQMEDSKLDSEKIEKLQQMLEDHLHKNDQKRDKEETENFLDFLQSNLENLRVSPSTKRILQQKQRGQHKRILGLAIAKRQTAAEIQRKIKEQQDLAEKHKNLRVLQETNIEEASQRKQEHLKNVTMKLRASNTVRQRNTEIARKKKNVTQLQDVLKSEQQKNTDQSNKIVKDVWEVLMKEQYHQLLLEVQKHKQEHKEHAERAAERLKKHKLQYEEQLKEIKRAAAESAANLGQQQKEIDSEVRKIRQQLKNQFNEEYSNLLEKIKVRGNHHRWHREEKAAQLKSEIQTAKYTFDL